MEHGTTQPLGRGVEKTPTRHCWAQAGLDPTVRLDHSTPARPTSRTHGHSVALSGLARLPQVWGSGTGCHGGNHGSHGPMGKVEVRTPSGRIHHAPNQLGGGTPCPAPLASARRWSHSARKWKIGQWQSWVVRPPRVRRTRRPYQSSYPTSATTAMTGYWGPLYRLMEYAPDDATANSPEPTRDLPVGRATTQGQRHIVRVRVRTRCAHRRRPPAGRHKYQGQQSVEDPQPQMSPPGEPIACGKFRDALLAHMRAAEGKISSRIREHERGVMDLLRLRWHTALLWIWDMPLAPEVKKADLQVLHEVLHELAVNGPPEDASTPVLGEGRKVSVQLAAKGPGSAGSVQVPPTLWEQWADPCFEWAGCKQRLIATVTAHVDPLVVDWWCSTWMTSW